jgi:hypothetical protein
LLNHRCLVSSVDCVAEISRDVALFCDRYSLFPLAQISSRRKRGVLAEPLLEVGVFAESEFQCLVDNVVNASCSQNSA